MLISLKPGINYDQLVNSADLNLDNVKNFEHLHSDPTLVNEDSSMKFQRGCFQWTHYSCFSIGFY